MFLPYLEFDLNNGATSYTPGVKKPNFFNAFEISAPYGGDVFSIESGVIIDVRKIGEQADWYVLIRHDNGMCSLLAHLDTVTDCTSGNRVSRGQVIGTLACSSDIMTSKLRLEIFYPEDKAITINPFASYYQGKIAVAINEDSLGEVKNVYGWSPCLTSLIEWQENCCSIIDGKYVFTP